MMQKCCGAVPEGMKIPPVLIDTGVTPIARKPFGVAVSEPAVCAAGFEIWKNSFVAGSRTLLCILQKTEPYQFTVDWHQTFGGFVLQPARRLHVNVEKPDPFLLANVRHMQLADFFLAGTGKNSDQRQPEFFVADDLASSSGSPMQFKWVKALILANKADRLFLILIKLKVGIIFYVTHIPI